MGHCPRCGNSYADDAAFCPEDGARLSPEGEGLVGVRLDDRYLLEEPIGAGGLGQVYRGRHLRMQKAFAVKLLLPTVAANADILKRFDREAQALSRLTHPCCVNVTDFGVSKPHGPYIVMELVEGVPLSHHTRGDGLPLQESVELVCMVLRGLEHAHGHGIAHRDLKPDNIMLIERPLEPGRLLPKILDFGLAKIRAGIGSSLGADLTQAGLILGTPSYMAPERITDPTQADDTIADIYSVGIILYELCCGRRPFVDDDLVAVLDMQRTMSPPPPRSLRPTIPAPLEAVVLRALAKRAEDRFQSASAFREHLEQLLPLPDAVAAEKPSTSAKRSTGAVTRVERPSSSPPPPDPATVRRGGRGRLLLVCVVALLALGGGLALLLTRGRQDPVSEPRAGRTDAHRRPARGTARRAPPRPALAAPDAGLPLALRRGTRLWARPRSRQKAARELMRYLARHRSDAAAHLYVGRLYLYALWADDGVKLVQRACRIDPSLRLDPSSLVALTFAYRKSSLWISRRLIDAHAGERAAVVMLASAVAMRDQRIRRNLIRDAVKRGAERDPLARRLLALARARSCKRRRAAFGALGGLDEPLLRIMLSLLRNSRCLSAEARRQL